MANDTTTPAVKAKLPQPTRRSLFFVLALAAACLVLQEMPIAGILFSPLQFFTTALHEIGHALSCNATGGSVEGLTIVSDGNGHGGLTYCRGGTPFIFGQMGYLGTTIFGCIMLWLARYQQMVKPLLVFMASVIAFAVVFYMPSAIAMPAHATQATMSMFVGALIVAGLLAIAKWLPPKVASFAVLFLAVQTAINALSDISLLLQISLGIHGGSAFTDASNMAQSTGVPAFIWSALWGIISALMLWATLKLAYGKSKVAQAVPEIPPQL